MFFKCLISIAHLFYQAHAMDIEFYQRECIGMPNINVRIIFNIKLFGEQPHVLLCGL